MTQHRLPSLGILRAFEAAARLSSFKAAAQELHVTRAAISQQIRTLEQDLGVELFVRSARSVTLTDTGRQLQPGLSDAFQRIKACVDNVRPPGALQIKVESSAPIVGKWLLPRLLGFCDQHPQLEVSLSSRSSLSELGEREPDVVIRFTRDPGPGLFAVKLCEELLVPLASPALVEQLGLHAPADLVQAPLLHDTSPDAIAPGFTWLYWFVKAGLDPSSAKRGVRFDPTSANHAIDAAINGGGVVLGRHFLAQRDIAAGRLVAPFGPVVAMHASYFLACLCGQETAPGIQAFFAWAQQEAANTAPSDAIIALGIDA